jgi:photosystem II stability/assembly factor-like uncharacterized protein
MKRFFTVLLALTAIIFCDAQKSTPTIEILTTGTNTSLRGLCVVNDNIVWVSGSHGTVGKSTNGGKNWKWVTVKGFEKRDFRDIEAFDATTAVIMAVDEPGYILRTVDGGDSWKVVYENKTKGMFLDAMEFWNDQAAIVVGDPIDGRFFITRSFDGGSTWADIPFKNRPMADSGEAIFASSGTNVKVLDRDEAVFVSGGIKSRMFFKDKVINLPIVQGKETTGANSITVYDTQKRDGGKKMIIVGGDFAADSSSVNNCFYTTDRGKTWHAPATPPHGYRSCVQYLSKKDVACCGYTGVDYSADGGKNWVLVSHESFNALRIAKLGPSIFLAGNNGRVGKIIWH